MCASLDILTKDIGIKLVDVALNYFGKKFYRIGSLNLTNYSKKFTRSNIFWGELEESGIILPEGQIFLLCLFKIIKRVPWKLIARHSSQIS